MGSELSCPGTIVRALWVSIRVQHTVKQCTECGFPVDKVVLCRKPPSEAASGDARHLCVASYRIPETVLGL